MTSKRLKSMSYGLAAVLLGVTLVFAQSAFKAGNEPNKVSSKNQATLFWYPVNASTNKIMSTYQYQDVKSNVISAQSCKDNADQPICLFGSDDDTLPVNYNVGTPDEDHRILQSNP